VVNAPDEKSPMHKWHGKSVLDVPLGVDTMRGVGTMLGTCCATVMAEGTDPVLAMQNLMAFYHHESCGQCTPCREGSLWMAKALHRLTHGQGRKMDADYLLKIADNIPGGRTICAFGEACAWPVQSFVGKFKDEFVARGAADEERGAAEAKDAGPVAETRVATCAES